MITWGISANSHDAALAVFSNGCIVFASHSERFSGIKNDGDLCENLIKYAIDNWGSPSQIYWYEKPLLKTFRQLYAGQGFMWGENNIKRYLSRYGINVPIKYTQHHKSHAAAGYYTSGFKDACIVVIDAIGEFETLTIWKGIGNRFEKVYAQDYPNSLGLWYSAMTQRCKLKPNEEEYILMGMAAYGDPQRLSNRIMRDFFEEGPRILTLKNNLHRGCLDWATELDDSDLFDIAAATQWVYEKKFNEILEEAKCYVNSNNLVLMGGCALNCSANPIAFRHFKNVWIMPNPGDAGSAIGCVLAHNPNWRIRLDSFTPFLGYNIRPKSSVKEIVEYILQNKICGVAQGRAEFGPRALGNRSLLADPRGADIKDRVNAIKKRQEFRPFAPVILEEFASDYFEICGNPSDHRYMQYTSLCKYPNLFPAIVHKDGTSRVQTVPNDRSRIRRLLERWYHLTGCPILLNTSLNIKGHPMVNNDEDARKFEEHYQIKVFT